MSEQSPPLRHLLNCRHCEWFEYVEGPSAKADTIRETHGESLRNRWDDDACPLDDIAWAFLPADAVVGGESA